MAAADNGEAYQAIRIMNGTAADLSKEENLKVVTLNEGDLKELGPKDVRVKVEAVALNPVDHKMNDLFPDHPKTHIMGSDAAGTVIDIGGEVENLKKGDTVLLNSQLKVGTFAEYVTIDSQYVGKYDGNGLTVTQAASLPLVSVTAHDAVEALGELEQGAKVMVNGASGGVGTMVTQICAKVSGYEVTAICSGKNESMVKDLGATSVINYKEADFAESGEQLDGFIDCVGGKSVWDKAQGLLKPNARFVTIVGDDPHLKAGSEAFKATWARSGEENAYNMVFYNTTSEKLEKIAGWVKEDKLKPMIHRVYPTNEIRDAMAELKTRRATGKIVLTFPKSSGAGDDA